MPLAKSTPPQRPSLHPGTGDSMGKQNAEFHALVHSVARLQRTQFDRALKPLGISRAQWWTLRHLARINRDQQPHLNQTELAILVGTTKASLGKLVCKMEAATLLERESCPRDQRAQRLTLTPKALSLLTQASHIEDALARLNCDGISQTALSVGVDVLLAADANMHKKHIGQRSGKAAGKISQLVQSFRHHHRPEKIGYLTDHISRIRQIIIDRLLLPIGLSRAQWAMLSFLAKQDGMTQSSLATAMNMSRAAVGSLLLKLEENQLIGRIPDPQDARSNRVFLAKAGSALLRSVGDTASQAEDFILAGIDPHDIAIATATLRRMKTNILANMAE